MDDIAKQEITKIYGELLRFSNQVLEKCKRFEIKLLQMEDPTIEEISDQLHEAADIIWAISEDYPDDTESYHIAAKATDYANHIKQIAKAIKHTDKAELDRLVHELDRRPFA